MVNKVTYVLAMTLLATLCFQGNAVKAGFKIEELEWSDLIPQGYNPDDLYEQYQKKYSIDRLPDDDPLVIELMQKLTDLEKSAPLNMALNDKFVKLPGFIVPLETDGEKSSEFLLVPYYGACIHVPPPPANQIVYVTTQDSKGASFGGMFDAVWVTGLMKAAKLSTDLGDAGYTILASKVEPYEAQSPRSHGFSSLMPVANLRCELGMQGPEILEDAETTHGDSLTQYLPHQVTQSSGSFV